jgi:hypothetical protein
MNIGLLSPVVVVTGTAFARYITHASKGSGLPP